MRREQLTEHHLLSNFLLKNSRQLTFYRSYQILICISIYWYQKHSPAGTLINRAANWHESTHAEVWFQLICEKTLLQLHLHIVISLWICFTFWEHLFIRTALIDRFFNFMEIFLAHIQFAFVWDYFLIKWKLDLSQKNQYLNNISYHWIAFFV